MNQGSIFYIMSNREIPLLFGLRYIFKERTHIFLLKIYFKH